MAELVALLIIAGRVLGQWELVTLCLLCRKTTVIKFSSHPDERSRFETSKLDAPQVRVTESVFNGSLSQVMISNFKHILAVHSF